MPVLREKLKIWLGADFHAKACTQNALFVSLTNRCSSTSCHRSPRWLPDGYDDDDVQVALYM